MKVLNPDVVRKAIDVINERGWYQGYFVDDSVDNGPVCALGAIHLGVGLTVEGIDPDWDWETGGDLPSDAVRRDLDSLVEELDALGLVKTNKPFFEGDRPVRLVHIPSWNDDPARTKDEVVETLGKLAEILERQPAGVTA